MLFRIRFLSFVCILNLFILICLARLAFAVDCSNYRLSVSYYTTAVRAQSAMTASKPADYYTYYGTSTVGSVADVCLGIAPGLSFYEYYKWIDDVQHGACFVIDSDCSDSDSNGDCDVCGDLESRLSSECGGPGTYEINIQDCIGHCLPTSQCAQAYEDACLRCGSCSNIAYFDNVRCIGVCEDCKDEYEQKKQECENPFPSSATGGECDYTCNCSDVMDEAERSCPFGFKMSPNAISPCEYSCLPCSELEKNCISKCNGKENVDMFFCEDVNGNPKDHLCQCKQSTCDEFYDSCHASCDTPECGGIKVSKCTKSGGEITYSRCECNGCSKTPENPDGPPPGDEGPTEEPGDGGDIVAWLKAIKGDTGRLVEQGDDHTAWFSSIKKNGDRTNQLLEYIAGKDIDTASVVSAIGVTNQKLDGIGGTLTDIKGMLSGSSSIDISTGTYTGDEMSEGGYGEAPTDADLPTAAATDAAFGTFATEGDGGYRNQISSALGGLSLPVSSPECSLVWTIPSSVPRLGGHSYHLNFCDYASLLASIGSVLVFMAAAYQLYLFS